MFPSPTSQRTSSGLVSPWMLHGGDLPEITSPVFIGILVAITGNILISLALNLQKLAHKRVEADTLRKQRHEGPIGKARRRADHDRNVDADGTRHGTEQEHLSTLTPGGNVGVALPASETESLLPFPITSQNRGYGARDSTIDSSPSAAPRTPLRPNGRHSFTSRSVHGYPAQSKNVLSNPELNVSALLPADVITIAGDASHSGEGQHGSQLDIIEAGNETDYLKSKLWYVSSLSPQIYL